MTALDALNWKSLAIYSAVGLFASLALFFTLGLSLHLERHVRRYLVPALMVMVLGVPVVSVLLSSRDLSALDFAVTTTGPSNSAIWFQRIASLLVVGLSLVRLIAQGFDRNKVRGGGFLLGGFIAYSFAIYVLSACFGTVRVTPPEQALYVALMVTTMFFSRGEDLDLVIKAARNTLLLIMLAGFVMMVVSPQIVLEHGYLEVRLPLVDFRYAGLASNPNAMAPLGLTSLMLALHWPFKRRLLTFVNIVAAGASVLLAQSQTTWIATIVALSIMYWFRFRPRLNDRRLLAAIAVVATLAIGAIAVSDVLSTSGSTTFGDLMSPEKVREVTSLTGRDGIWLAAFSEWRDNPLFGYGPTMWGDEFRARIGMNYAFSAHNQFIQALAVGGIVGIVGLVYYLLCMFVGVARVKGRHRAFLIAMFATLLLRCLTETPMETGSPFVNELGPHLLLFLVLAASLRRPEQHASPVRDDSIATTIILDANAQPAAQPELLGSRRPPIPGSMRERWIA